MWQIFVAIWLWNLRWTSGSDATASPDRARLRHLDCGFAIRPLLGCGSCRARGVTPFETSVVRHPEYSYDEGNPPRPYRRIQSHSGTGPPRSGRGRTARRSVEHLGARGRIPRRPPVQRLQPRDRQHPAADPDPATDHIRRSPGADPPTGRGRQTANGIPPDHQGHRLLRHLQQSGELVEPGLRRSQRTAADDQAPTLPTDVRPGLCLQCLRCEVGTTQRCVRIRRADPAPPNEISLGARPVGGAAFRARSARSRSVRELSRSYAPSTPFRPVVRRCSVPSRFGFSARSTYARRRRPRPATSRRSRRRTGMPRPLRHRCHRAASSRQIGPVVLRDDRRHPAVRRIGEHAGCIRAERIALPGFTAGGIIISRSSSEMDQPTRCHVPRRATSMSMPRAPLSRWFASSVDRMGVPR